MRRLRTLFSLRSQSVRQASTLLAVTAVISNVLGLGRNLIFYRLVPLDQLDVYFASFRVADLIFNLFILGAITSAVIPVLTELVTANQSEKSDEVTRELLSWISVFFIALIVILWIFMSPVVERIVPNFDPSRLALTVRLSRLVLLQTFFFSWSYVIGALLNAHRRFATYAYAPLLYNSILILGGVAASRFGVGAITYSVVLGSFLHFLIQAAEARRIGFRFIPSWDGSPELKSIIRLMWPRSISQGILQITLIAYTRLASGLPRGSLAIFSGINDLQTTPTVVIANSLATAYFPTLAGLISSKEHLDTDKLVNKALRMTLFTMLPIAALGLTLRAQTVRLYIAIGGANWNQTEAAIRTFAWFMLAIVPAALVVILARIFYAHKDSRTPMWIVIFSGILGITLSYTGIQMYGGDVATLAQAEAIISFSQCILYLILIRQRNYVQLDFIQLSNSVARYVLGCIFASASAWITLRVVEYSYRYIPYLSTSRILGLFIQGSLSALVGALAYLTYAKLSSKEEMQWARLTR